MKETVARLFGQLSEKVKGALATTKKLGLAIALGVAASASASSSASAHIHPLGPATLSSASVVYHVRDDDKDHDSSESMSVSCGSYLAADAQALGSGITWHDQTDVGPLMLNNIDHNIEPSDCGTIHVETNHSTVGDDNFRFAFTVTLTFSDGSRTTYDSGDAVLTKENEQGAWDIGAR